MLKMKHFIVSTFSEFIHCDLLLSELFNKKFFLYFFDWDVDIEAFVLVLHLQLE